MNPLVYRLVEAVIEEFGDQVTGRAAVSLVARFSELVSERRLGRPTRHCSLSPEERRAEVRRLRDEGVSIQDIARAIQVSDTTVSRDLAALAAQSDVVTGAA